MTFALMPALVFSVSGLGLRGGSLSRAMLLWNVFVLLFMWRNYSQGLNLSSPPSVSDSPSQLEAFWTLSVISLGRLELFHLLVLFIDFNVHQNLGDAGNANKYFSLPSSFCLSFFFFSFFVLLNFLFLPSCRVLTSDLSLQSVWVSPFGTSVFWYCQVKTLSALSPACDCNPLK